MTAQNKTRETDADLRYDSGIEGDMFGVGFSLRKANLAICLVTPDDESERLLARLGNYRTEVSCLYGNRLADVDADVLEALATRSWDAPRREHGEVQSPQAA